LLKIGITGGIGSGKSTVTHIFEVLGIPVYDADSRAKQLMEENDSLKEKIIKTFGNEAYLKGKLNRAHLATIVFQTPEKLQVLNHIVHPVTIADANEWMQKQKSPYCIKEAALIFESGSDTDLNGVIGVTASEELRIKRVMQRDGSSESEVRSRMNRQMDETEKMKRCNWVIQNDGSTSLIEQVLNLHQQFIEKAR